MMQHLLIDAVDNFFKLRRIPVFIPLKDYSEANKELEDFVFSEARNFNTAIDQEVFTNALKEGLFLLLFDGLDEIDYNYNGNFEREIERYSDRYPKNCFVISSRPFQSFTSFARYSKVKLQPFNKEQALKLVDRLTFRPDKPEIKRKFRIKLDETLYSTHRNFAQNPLLLTIMLMTYERYSEVPTKMHIFYREAFLTLSVSHDATKGAFRGALKTGLEIDKVEKLFAEICFRSYRDEKYEFTEREFIGYFDKLKEVNKIKARDFLYDMHHNLCVMYLEGARYHFIHRSFQEYFAAVFLSNQTDEFVSRLGNFFEGRSTRMFENSTFSMLYDIIQEKVEQFIFIPYLKELFAKCNAGEGYWTFLEEEFPVIYYESGDVDERAHNDPQSYILQFILRQLDYKHTLSTVDLPFYKSLVVEEVLKDVAPILAEHLDNDSNVAKGMNAVAIGPYCNFSEDGKGSEPEIVGHKLEFVVKSVRKHPADYDELLTILNDNGFILKQKYYAAKEYLEILTSKIKERRDDLSDLL